VNPHDLSSEEPAHPALFAVANALLSRLGEGVHRGGATSLYDVIQDVPGVPAAVRSREGCVHVSGEVAKLFADLQSPVLVRRHEIVVRPGCGNWELHITQS